MIDVCMLKFSDLSGYDMKQISGRGISKMLLTALENHAREQGYGKLFLDTRITFEPAVSLYRKSGFEIIFKQGLYV